MHRLTTAVLTLAMIAGAAIGADAKTCRDAHGKFMKCSTMMSHSMMKKKQCRDAHGKFMKCKM